MISVLNLSIWAGEWNFWGEVVFVDSKCIGEIGEIIFD